MRLGEYFEIGKRMKQARTNAGINQRDMSVKLALTNSSYSNYENGYSEPPVETILKFCDILGITLNDLLEVKVVAPKTASIKTFADFLAILIDLDRRGLRIKGNTTYSQEQSTYGSSVFRHTKRSNCYLYSRLEQGKSAACRWID